MSRPSPSKDSDGLSLQERLFVKHFIASNGKGAESAKAAGYSGDCKKRAHDVLSRPKVWRAIQLSVRPTLTELQVKAERVLLELVRIAFFDPRRLFHTSTGGLLIPSLWPEEVSACVSGFELNKEGQISKIRLCSKSHAIELLGRYLKLWEGAGDAKPDRLEEIVTALREANEKYGDKKETVQ